MFCVHSAFLPASLCCFVFWHIVVVSLVLTCLLLLHWRPSSRYYQLIYPDRQMMLCSISEHMSCSSLSKMLLPWSSLTDLCCAFCTSGLRSVRLLTFVFSFSLRCWRERCRFRAKTARRRWPWFSSKTLYTVASFNHSLVLIREESGREEIRGMDSF